MIKNDSCCQFWANNSFQSCPARKYILSVIDMSMLCFGRAEDGDERCNHLHPTYPSARSSEAPKKTQLDLLEWISLLVQASMRPASRLESRVSLVVDLYSYTGS